MKKKFDETKAGGKLLNSVHAPKKQPKNTNQKEEINMKKVITITVLVTLVVAGALAYYGYYMDQRGYNRGVQDEKGINARIESAVSVKSSKQ